MSTRITIAAIALTSLLALPVSAAEQVTINGEKSIHCYWTGAAAAMRKAALKGKATIEARKLGKEHEASVKCSNERKAKTAAKKAAKKAQ